MPIQPTYPGVYIQEVSSGVRTITGVSTSIAAFFGRTLKGPINRAVRCLSYSDFLREFGGGHPMSETGQSVKQFFDNGGTDCYVIRVAGATAAAASVTLRRFKNSDAAVNANVLVASAKGAGLWGQDIKLDVDYNTANPNDTFNLRVSHESGNVVVTQEYHQGLSMNPLSPKFAPAFVSQSSNLIDLSAHPADMGDPTNAASFIRTWATVARAGYSDSRRMFSKGAAPALLTEIKDAFDPTKNGDKTSFIIKMNDDSAKEFTVDLAGLDLSGAADPAAVASTLTIFINNAIHLSDPASSVTVEWIDLSGLLANTGHFRIKSASAPFTAVSVRRANAKDIAGPFMLGIDQGGIEVNAYSNLRPFPSGSYYWGDKGLTDLTGAIDEFALSAQTVFNKITIGGVDTAVNLNTGQARIYLQAGGIDGVREKLQTLAAAVNNDVNSPAIAELWGGYNLVLRKKTGGINDSLTVVTSAGAGFGSDFASNARRYSLGAVGSALFQIVPGIPGNDGGTLAVGDYTGSELLHTGFFALDKVDLFNLMIIPHDEDIDESEYQQLFGPATAYCNNKRAFLLIDAPASWTDGEKMDADAAKVNALRAGIVKDHSAIFYPRVRFSDNGIIKPMGPSGLIAGLMARTDSERGVWKAPAGIEADLRGVLDVELNMTDGENGVLNKLGVNCIRKFPNGIVNWGARTLDGSDDFGSEWKYIPIRRLALFLEESLFRGTKWVVFEPNDEPLWAKIRMNLNAFMFSLFRQGAFQGSTPDKAFFVKCDGETTTANDRNLGIVNIQVGFAPLKPAEFVIITIQQIPDV